MAKKASIGSIPKEGVVEEVVEESTPNSVKVSSVFNRMRNPHTGAVFNKHKTTDVIDLDSKDNSWTRAQIAAKVLKVVE